MILFLFEEVYKKRIKDGPLGKPIEQEKTDVHVSTSIFEIRNNKKKEVPDDLENHIYVKYNFHVDESEVKKVIHQILTHDTNDNSHDDSFSWIELVNIVEKWEKRVGFSWNKPDEMKDSSKFRILPVFYETIRLGSRKDQSTSPDYLVIYAWFVICFINNLLINYYPSFQSRCDMPYCQTIIAGKNKSIRRKNYKKHFSSHFYTVRNQPCKECGFMNQKLGSQIDNHKFYDR